jgi:TPR repeat protein
MVCFKGSNDIEKDPVVAIQWFRLAAAQNHPLARHMLAYCLSKGEGVEQNKEEAVTLWRELANENNPSAQYNLASLLTEKDFSGYNPKEGIELLRKSAKQQFTGQVPATVERLRCTFLTGHDFLAHSIFVAFYS